MKTKGRKKNKSTLPVILSQTSRQSTDKWTQALAKAHAAQNALVNIDCKRMDCEESAENGLELLFERFVIPPCELLDIFYNVYFIASVRLLDKVGSQEDWDDDRLEMKVDNVLSEYRPSPFVED